MSNTLASKKIDDIIDQYSGWKGDLIKKLRDIIRNADPEISEEIKWKAPSRPEGLPVWTSNGIVCFIEIWKDNVKLIFFKGALLTDSSTLFNARLKSSTLRAIEFHESDPIETASIKALIIEAVDLNAEKAKRPTT